MTEKATYKIFRSAEWAAFEATGRFAGSPDDARDGFIHLSAADQIAGVLERYFAGEADVVVAAMECPAERGQLKWEASTGGALYPHFYGAFEIGDVVRSERIAAADGVFSLPDWVG